ncbi:hypothetical protein THASP1DRAFT_24059 [Thamnocephalis sphaerospora]|uniref:Uncharacterized protein n=1 Tax=Thamnocephalis sphaerospora TaxID=78915 RepID=A0A4P9XPC7_9FUNG|nr:hypothetical protein THASP1DRAFT_24059 [Thamnocephalis sphaerospora]|eukprot:RKP07854.1 hypothetical protein THASP1DRAFT_24059 [Thamnocephalis sphaerospora]
MVKSPRWQPQLPRGTLRWSGSPRGNMVYAPSRAIIIIIIIIIIVMTILVGRSRIAATLPPPPPPPPPLALSVRRVTSQDQKSAVMQIVLGTSDVLLDYASAATTHGTLQRSRMQPSSFGPRCPAHTPTRAPVYWSNKYARMVPSCWIDAEAASSPPHTQPTAYTHPRLGERHVGMLSASIGRLHHVLVRYGP